MRRLDILRRVRHPPLVHTLPYGAVSYGGLRRRQAQLTPEDWAKTALRAIARGGVEAVAVESVAAELGATKGSFYWHFENRDALIRAALDRWERRRTGDVIEDLEREPDPARRLKNLMSAAFERGPYDSVEIALLANPGHPIATAAVRRVTERRINYMSRQLEQLGWRPETARDRAMLLYYLYIGFLQMAHVLPSAIERANRERHLDLVLDAFVSAPLPTTTARRISNNRS